MRIFLVGFMGSGKSHTGKRLAQFLSFEFIDLDHIIEQQQQKTISSIFMEDGESVFRKIEQEALHNTLYDTAENLIISCGGGVPCFFDNMNWMNQHGITVFLNASVSILIQRLIPEIINRPLLKNKSEEELQQFINAKLLGRLKFYEQAMITFNQTSYNIDTARILNDYFKEIIGH